MWWFDVVVRCMCEDVVVRCVRTCKSAVLGFVGAMC